MLRASSSPRRAAAPAVLASVLFSALLVALLLGVAPLGARAQDGGGTPPALPSEARAASARPNATAARPKAARPKAPDLTGYATVEAAQGVYEQPWPRADLPFVPDAPAVPAGDVNGDGLADWLYRYARVADDRTPDDLGDVIAKTLLAFGRLDFDAALYDEAVYTAPFDHMLPMPVGRLAGGDAFADALVRETAATVRLLLGSASGYADGGVSLTVGDGSTPGFEPRLSAFGDLDGDGVGDAVLVPQPLPGSTEGRFIVVFGATDPADVTARTFETNTAVTGPVTLVIDLAVADLDGDGTAEIVRFLEYGNAAPGNPSLDVLRVTRDGPTALAPTQRLDLTSPAVGDLGPDATVRDYVLTVADAGGTDAPELLLTRGVDVDATDDALLVFVADDLGLYDPDPLVFPEALPAGDLDADGRLDFLRSDQNGNLYLALGPETLADGLGFDAFLPRGDELRTRLPASADPLGDATGDGRDDLLLPFAGDVQFGYRFYSLVPDPAAPSAAPTERAEAEDVQAAAAAAAPKNFTDNLVVEAITFANADYLRRTVVHRTANAGDFDGDGSDDVALVLRTEGSGVETIADEAYRVEVFTGDLAQPPALTLAPAAAAEIASITSGDFDGDGQPEIVLALDRRDPSTPDETALLVYEAGSGATPVAAFTLSDLDPDADLDGAHVARTVRALGDVNADGIDDLGFSLSVEGLSGDKSDVYVLFGQADLTSATVLNVTHDARVDPLEGNGLHALGDVNADGVDDFAVAEPFSGPPTALGNVYVYFGQDAASSTVAFAAPDVTLDLPTEGGERQAYGSGLAAGDFNGDGTPDLATKPLLFRSEPGGEGVAALFVYDGGPGFDDVPDAAAFVPGPPLDGPGALSGPRYLRESLGELRALPDLDGDGADEILLGTVEGTNALVYAGQPGGGPPVPVTVLVAPNETMGLGRDLARSGDEHAVGERSAVGDFDGDGRLDVVMPQAATDDSVFPFRAVSAYAYALAPESVPATVTVGVEAGWNLVASPLASNAPFAQVLPSCSSGFLFDPATGYTALGADDALPLGTGGFFFCDAGAAAFTGARPDAASTLDVSAGWNLVGPFDAPVAVSTITSVPAGLVNSAFFGFSPEAGYVAVEVLQPGRAYWVNVSADGTLTLAP